MAQAAQLDELSAQHKALERKIQEELAHPASDDLKIAELKRQKLRLKEEIVKLESGKPH